MALTPNVEGPLGTGRVLVPARAGRVPTDTRERLPRRGPVPSSSSAGPGPKRHPPQRRTVAVRAMEAIVAAVPKKGGGAPPPAVRLRVRGRLRLYRVPVLPSVTGRPDGRVRQGAKTPFSYLAKTARRDAVATATGGGGGRVRPRAANVMGVTVLPRRKRRVDTG